jgi:FkbM family methyltransferase
MKFSDVKSQFQAGIIDKPAFIRGSLSHHRALFDYVDVVRSTDIREIRIASDGVSFVIGDEGIRLYCPPGEARVAPLEVMNFDRYEPEETRVMDLLAADAKVILDVGANIGWYAVRFAKRLPQARVFAFEPLPTSHSYLQRNVAVNGVGDRVATFNCGLSDSSGAVEFFISPASGTNASLKNVAGAADAQPVVGLTITLDEWIANQKLAPDFIKCDVEGAELLVFRGGRATLAKHRPVVFAELLRKWSKPFGYHPNDAIRFFDDLGYDCFGVGASGVKRLAEVTDETPETNYAFVHREAHRQLIAALGALE